MAEKRLVSPDGRRTVVATGQEEIDRLEDEGYVAPSARRKAAEPANSGLVGQLKARASSTTEGQERNTGSTVELPEDPFGDEDESEDEAPAESDDDAEKAAAARVAQKAAARPTARKSA